MQIGYARVSTDDQKLELQRDALRSAGCDKIFDEKISGAGPRLVARDELLRFARTGDVVVVWRLDRLGRSLRDLIDVVTTFLALHATSPGGDADFGDRPQRVDLGFGSPG